MSKNKNHFLDHPEVKRHFESVFPIIIEESDRGAVLIAASQVDLFLEKALKEIAPKNISKKRLKSIFDFSGPLGTFSSRIDMAYFFRIINKDVFLAIHILRDLRNDVAHKPEIFSLSDHQNRISNLYKLGPGIPDGVHQWAIEGVMQTTVNKSLELKDPSSTENKPIFSEAKEVIEYISQKPNIMKILEDKLPKWKLGLGTALICGIIFYGSDNAYSVLGDHSTFNNINSKKNKDKSNSKT